MTIGYRSVRRRIMRGIGFHRWGSAPLTALALAAALAGSELASATAQAPSEEVEGADLEAWFHRALASTEELDHSEALEWYGLAFAADGSWRLEVRDDATDAQQAHLRDLLASASPGQEGATAAGDRTPSRRAPATPQQALPIRGEDPPPSGIWVETVGLDAMFQRRGRPVAGGVPGGRGGAVRP
ncbi:MAG TPA: hypothetical protein VE173_02855, partial [Longimicrobiales bacterium]|nr:hypothetical protein [Longimicrobiales bacterium]